MSVSMTYHFYYCREHRCWYAFWQDESGNQLGDAVDAHTKEQVLIQLGMIKDSARKLNQKEGDWS